MTPPASLRSPPAGPRLSSRLDWTRGLPARRPRRRIAVAVLAGALLAVATPLDAASPRARWRRPSPTRPPSPAPAGHGWPANARRLRREPRSTTPAAARRDEATIPRSPRRPAVGPPPRAARGPTWGLVEGDEIAPGRTVLRRLGGGSRYEVLPGLGRRALRRAGGQAAPARPGRATPWPGATCEREADVLARLAHPVLVRSFDAVPGRPVPAPADRASRGPDAARAVRPPRRSPRPSRCSRSTLHVAAVSALPRRRADGSPRRQAVQRGHGRPAALIDLSVARDVARRPHGSAARWDRRLHGAGAVPPGPRGTARPAGGRLGLCATIHHALAGAHARSRGAGRARVGEPRGALPAARPRPRRRCRAAPRPALAALVSAGLAPDPAARPVAAELAAGLEPLVPVPR